MFFKTINRKLFITYLDYTYLQELEKSLRMFKRNINYALYY